MAFVESSQNSIAQINNFAKRLDKTAMRIDRYGDKLSDIDYFHFK